MLLSDNIDCVCCSEIAGMCISVVCEYIKQT